MQNTSHYVGGGPGNSQPSNPDVQPGHLGQFMNSVLHSLQQQPPGIGWRAQVSIQERVGWIKQIIDSLRLLPQSGNDLVRRAQGVVNLEHTTWNNAVDKEAYVRECVKKLGAIKDTRAKQVHAQSQSRSTQNLFPQMHQTQQMGQNLSFPPQLQHQMQASPIPQSQGLQLGANNGPTLNARNGGGPAGRGVQSAGNAVQGQQPRSNASNMPPWMTQDDYDGINRLALQFAQHTSQDDRLKIRQVLLRTMPPEQLQNMKARGVDLMSAYFGDRASKEWRRQRQALAGSQSNVSSDGQPILGVPAQRSGNPPVNASGPSGGRGVPANIQNVGAPFSNHPDHFQGMQADGLRSQRQGHLVVPASDPQGMSAEELQLQQLVSNAPPVKQNPNARVNQPFLTQPSQPVPAQQGQGSQQMEQKQTEQSGNIAASLQAQQQGRPRAETDPRTPQQQTGLQSELHSQPVSQSGTPASTLARPLGGTGQGPAPTRTNGTPQPRPHLRAPNSGPPAAAPMQQTPSQERLQNNSQQPGSNPAPMLALPIRLQAMLRDCPRGQWTAVIHRYMQQQAMRQNHAANGVTHPMSQTLSQPGHGPHTPNDQHPGDGLTGSLPMQQSVSAGPLTTQIPPQRAAPGQSTTFLPQHPQPAPSQPQQHGQRDINHLQGFATPTQQPPRSVTQSGNLSAGVPDLIAFMDQQHVPPRMLQNFAQVTGLPGHIKLWAHLKQYMVQNPSPNLPMDKISTAQGAHWNSILRSQQTRPVGQQYNPSQPVSVPQTSSHFLPIARDQPLQGIPAMDQKPRQMMDFQPPVTSDEILRLRMSSSRLAQLPEHQLRAFVPALRQSEAQKRAGFHPQPPDNQHVTFVSGQPQPPASQSGPARQQPLPPSALGPGTNLGPFPQGQSANLNSRAPISTPLPANHPPNTANHPTSKGAKRSTVNAGAVGTPGEMAVQSGSQQPPQGSPRATPSRAFSREELARLTPEQQKIYRENFQKRQLMLREHIGRLSEEVRRSGPSLHPLDMPAAARARLVKVLTAPETKQIFTRFNGLLCQYYVVTKNSEGVKQLLQYKMHLFPQYTLDSVRACTWETARQFSITAEYAETAIQDITSRFREFASRAGPQPLSQDNLTKHNEADIRNVKRRAQEVPAAPTASQPPFQLSEGSPRGHGTPRYPATRAKPDLNLVLPSKRQKKTHDSNAAPISAGGQVTPGPSPEAAKVGRTDDMPFKCVVAGCEYHNKGFATKIELDSHSVTVHKPVEEYIGDPLAFVLESVRGGLGLDEHGDPEAKSQTAEKQNSNPKPAATPGMKSSTPTAHAGVSMSRDASRSGGVRDAASKARHTLGADDRPGSNMPLHTGANAAATAWAASKISIPELQRTFGDLVGDARPSPSLHDPLASNDDLGDFMDQFMESEAWTKVQTNITAATMTATDTTSTKAAPTTTTDNSPALLSDEGQGGDGAASTSSGKLDDAFIKIGVQDTELAESWALPELKFNPENGTSADGPSADNPNVVEKDVDEWMKMDWEDLNGDENDGKMDIKHDTRLNGNVDLGVDFDFDVGPSATAMEMDFDWKEVDWDSLRLEQEQEQEQEQARARARARKGLPSSSGMRK